MTKVRMLMVAVGCVMLATVSAQAALTDGVIHSIDAAQPGGVGGQIQDLAGNANLMLGANAAINNADRITFDGSLGAWSPFTNPIDIPNDGSVTIEMWVNDFASTDPDATNWATLMGSFANPGEDNFVFRRGRHADYQTFFAWNDATQPGDYIAMFLTTNDETAHQLVIVLEETGGTPATSMTAYSDGVLVTEGLIGNCCSGSDRLHEADTHDLSHVPDIQGLGGAWDHFNNVLGTTYPTGSIHSVTFWDRALSAAEVDESFQDGAGGYIPEPSTVALLALGGLAIARRRR